ncbi:MAG TPA: LPS export ABC transporter periplasmic protein LptC [Mucilaginibacter sp.]
MDSRAQKLFTLGLPVLCICMLLVSACENSLSDIRKIASKEEEKPISRSTGVDVIYSDSAKVKARLITPLMIELDDPKSPYQEMPKGVKITFYDDNLKEKGTITSDYAIRLEKENKITFRKNVVATNAQGETFKSEELIYDQTSKKIYTNKPVQINMGNGDVMQGVGANSNESLYPWHIEQSTGIFKVDEKTVQ